MCSVFCQARVVRPFLFFPLAVVDHFTRLGPVFFFASFLLILLATAWGRQAGYPRFSPFRRPQGSPVFTSTHFSPNHLPRPACAGIMPSSLCCQSPSICRLFPYTILPPTHLRKRTGIRQTFSLRQILLLTTKPDWSGLTSYYFLLAYLPHMVLEPLPFLPMSSFSPFALPVP